MNPIVGPRFKKIGENYDLCEEAFEALPEDEKYFFVRIDVPEEAESLELQFQIRHLADDVFQLLQGGEPGQQAYNEVDGCNSFAEAMEKFKRFETQAEAARNAEVEAEVQDVNEPEPVEGVQKSLLELNNAPRGGMQFLEDLSLPDGSQLQPGTTISKNWRVVNCGAEQWPADTRLEHVEGCLFDGSEPCPVPQLEPGQE